MRKALNKYEFVGAVYIFNKMVAPHWYGQTYAVSEEKARSNLEYQYKKKHGYLPNANIHLSGDLMLVY